MGRRAFARFTLRELVLISAMAAVGIAIKPIVVPLAHLISAPLLMPGGALAGGLYMMWLVVAVGLTGKRGTATLVGLVQAILVMITGITGSHGVMSLVTYTLPGLAVDLGLLLIRHRVCCMPCAFFAGVLANLAGTATVASAFFNLPLIPLLLRLAVAAFSGGVGGILSWLVIKALSKYGIGGPAREKKHSKAVGAVRASDNPAAITDGMRRE